MVKRSSLLQKVVTYGRKKFYNFGPCSNPMWMPLIRADNSYNKGPIDTTTQSLPSTPRRHQTLRRSVSAGGKLARPPKYEKATKIKKPFHKSSALVSTTPD
jgi:hypothetical protein